ncbi:MAG: hypothetical protein AAB265_12025 [candidate division NC10 bacterium]
MPTVTPLPTGTTRDLGTVFLPLTKDGRLADDRALAAVEERLPLATDCFVFCPGWLYDRAEARAEGARFFSLLDGALAPLRGRLRPLRVALHWPSKPFAEEPPEPAEPAADATRSPAGPGWPELLRGLDPASLTRGRLRQLLLTMAEAEIPRGPEEELELDRLLRSLREPTVRGGLPISPAHALSFWMMKRRAGEVGERVGREHLGPLLARLGDSGPRLHLIGHSFGAKVLTSAVLAGLAPRSLTLLLAAFSAFAFAEEVPGTDRPGHYRPLLSERRVSGPIVVLHSAHDRALGSIYPAVTGAGQIDRAPNPGRLGHVREVVAASALGFAGARGVLAPQFDLVEVQRTGLPRQPVINVNASKVVRDSQWLLGAHRDIYHPEIATLVLMAAGQLEGSPEGPRRPPLSPWSEP